MRGTGGPVQPAQPYAGADARSRPLSRGAAGRPPQKIAPSRCCIKFVALIPKVTNRNGGVQRRALPVAERSMLGTAVLPSGARHRCAPHHGIWQHGA